MKIAVSSADARAARSNAGSRTKTIVPAGVDLLAVDREDRVSAHHGEELLVAVRLVLLVVGLVMRFDHLVAGVSGRGVHAERLDVEMATDEMKRGGVSCARSRTRDIAGEMLVGPRKQLSGCRRCRCAAMNPGDYRCR
jgi:hypothetical protein